MRGSGATKGFRLHSELGPSGPPVGQEGREELGSESPLLRPPRHGAGFGPGFGPGPERRPELPGPGAADRRKDSLRLRPRAAARAGPSVWALSSVFGLARCANDDLVGKRAGAQWPGPFPQRRAAQAPRLSRSELRWPKGSTERSGGPALLTGGIAMSQEGPVRGSVFTSRLLTKCAPLEGADTPVCTFTPGTGGWRPGFHWLCEKELVREGAETGHEVLKGRMSMVTFGS